MMSKTSMTSVGAWNFNLTEGTELWNGTAILRKRAGNNLDKPLGQRKSLEMKLTRVRYMACLMIEIGSTSDKQSRFRIFQTFLKTANYCMGNLTIDLTDGRFKGK